MDEQQMQASRCNIEYQYHHPIISAVSFYGDGDFQVFFSLG